MSGWKAKRFWTDVTVEPEGVGFGVRLDARPVRTPAKAALILPSRALAEAVAGEWAALADEVDPRAMPATRRANAAIDKVAPQFAEVAAMVAAYGASDLLCYRAEAPEELTLAQADAWDPLLRWAAETLGAPLRTTRGIVPVSQPPGSLAKLSDLVHSCSPFELTALHDLVSLSGSLVLGLAATRDEFDAETLWHLSRFDENWQIAQWGEDEEAAEAAERKRSDFLFARHFWEVSQAS